MLISHYHVSICITLCNLLLWILIPQRDNFIFFLQSNYCEIKFILIFNLCLALLWSSILNLERSLLVRSGKWTLVVRSIGLMQRGSRLVLLQQLILSSLSHLRVPQIKNGCLILGWFLIWSSVLTQPITQIWLLLLSLGCGNRWEVGIWNSNILTSQNPPAYIIRVSLFIQLRAQHWSGLTWADSLWRRRAPYLRLRLWSINQSNIWRDLAILITITHYSSCFFH